MQEDIHHIEKHYSRKHLYETILQQLRELGIDKVTRKDIAPADEFHVRGAAASFELLNESDFTSNTKVLDIGSGLGGPCRMIAEQFGCKVTGIDITKDYIETATKLSALTGLGHLTEFIHADALQLPFAHQSFDIVWTQHVQMNVKDKQQFYTEAKRVLTKNGLFIYYDIFTKNNGPVTYPVPWADTLSDSFLFTTTELDSLLLQIGFSKIKTTGQTAAGIQFFETTLDKIEREGFPKIGLHLVIGDMAFEKLKNLLKNLKEGNVELQSGVYRKAE